MTAESWKASSLSNERVCELASPAPMRSWRVTRTPLPARPSCSAKDASDRRNRRPEGEGKKAPATSQRTRTAGGAVASMGPLSGFEEGRT